MNIKRWIIKCLKCIKTLVKLWWTCVQLIKKNKYNFSILIRIIFQLTCGDSSSTCRLINFQVSYDEDGCYSKDDYFSEDNKYELYLQVKYNLVKLC